MGYSNSPLVTYTNISPNKTVLTGKVIDTITIHCVVGQCTAKSCCDYFAIERIGASSNYVVGCDGSIGLSVDEKDRAWTTGGGYTVNGETGSKNDYHAITIEVASDIKYPYAVTDKAYNALIQLVADICKRNNIKKLLWKADKNLVGKPDKQNMTVHRWFCNKSCPGDYLYNKHGEIAEKVNAILEAPVDEKTDHIYRVRKAWNLPKTQKGAFVVWMNAVNCCNLNPGYSIFDEKGTLLYTNNC